MKIGLDNETLAIALHFRDGLDLIQDMGIANCRDVTTEKLRTGQSLPRRLRQ
jgi:hypothetical protein